MLSGKAQAIAQVVVEEIQVLNVQILHILSSGLLLRPPPNRIYVKIFYK